MKSVQKILLMVSVGIILVFIALRSYIFSSGQLLFSEYTVTTNPLFFIHQFSYAWNTYFGLGHSQIGYPIVPGSLGAIHVINPVSVLPEMYKFLFLQTFFKSSWETVYFSLSLFLSYLGGFLFTNYFLKENYNIPGRKRAFLSILSGVIFLVNPMLSDRVGSGGMRYNFVQALIPFFPLFYLECIKCFGLWRKFFIWFFIFSLLFFYAISLFPHMGVVIFLFFGLDILLQFFVYKNTLYVKKALIILAAMTLSVIALYCYVLLPGFFYHEIFIAGGESSFFSLQGIIVSQDASVLNLIRLVASSQINPLLSSLLFILPLLTILTLIKIEQKRKIYFLILISVFVFLAKGLNPPFVHFSAWLFLYTYFLHPFRDPTIFTSFLAFLYAWIVPLFFVYYEKVLKKFNKRILYFAISALILIILLANPLFISGNFNGALSKVKIPKEYYLLQQYINTHAKDKVIILPFESSVRYETWYNKTIHSSGHPTIFHLYLPLSVPIANAYIDNVDNTYSQQFMEYIQSIKDPEFLSLMLEKAGIEYIIFDNNMEKNVDLYANFLSLKQPLEQSNEYIKEKSIGNLEIYKLKRFDNSFFSYSNNPLYVVGNLNTFNDLYNVNQNLLLSPIIFLNQEQTFNKVDLKNQTIFFDNTTIDDLIGNQIVSNSINFNTDFSSRLSPHGWLDYENLKIGLERQLNNYALTFESNKAFGTEEKTIYMKHISTSPGTYVLYVHPLFGSLYKGAPFGQLGVTVDQKKFTINLKTKSESYLKWINLGKVTITKSSVVGINNEQDGLAFVDGIVLIRKKDYENIVNSTYAKLHDAKVFYNSSDLNLSLPQSVNTSITFKQIDPTKYIVNTYPEGALFLTFRQNYSPYWILGNQKAIPVDYFGNGFITSPQAKKSIILYYEPQGLYNKLLLFSTLLFACFVLVLCALCLLFISSRIKKAFKKSKKK